MFYNELSLITSCFILHKFDSVDLTSCKIFLVKSCRLSPDPREGALFIVHEQYKTEVHRKYRTKIRDFPHLHSTLCIQIEYSDVLYTFRWNDDITNRIHLPIWRELAKNTFDDVWTLTPLLPQIHITRGAKIHGFNNCNRPSTHISFANVCLVHLN